MLFQRFVIGFFAALCLCRAVDVAAADTAWIGAAGPAQPYWDLGTNWSAGPPSSASTQALLGSFDTSVRSGSFQASSLSGSGMLTIIGGALDVASGVSTIGGLDLRGGTLSGQGGVSTERLNLTGGTLSSHLSVSGVAVIGGAISGSGSLTMLGDTLWQDGASNFAGLGSLAVGTGGTFHDVANGGGHSISNINLSFTNDGRYEKTGAAATDFTSHSFVNTGTLDVREGRLGIGISTPGYAGATWTNQGQVTLGRGAQLSASLYRGSYVNSGRIDVNGQMTLERVYTTDLNSTGDWNIADGGTLTFIGSLPGGAASPRTAQFTAGTVDVAGTLRFSVGANTFSGTSRLGGSGLLEVVNATSLSIGSDVTIGHLRLADPAFFQPVPSYVKSSTSVAGRLTVGTLDWAEANLSVSGPVTVNGKASLSEDIQKTLLNYFGTPVGGPSPAGKRMDTAFSFNGGVVWDGNSDLYGTGKIAVAAGTVFQDLNSVGTFDRVNDGSPARPTRIAVGGFDNAGTYLKTGAGPTVMSSAVNNTGTVRAVDAGVLTLSGAIDNTGAIEAVRSRVVLFGPLAQASLQPTYVSTYRSADLVLTAGRYVMQNGQIVLNVGANALGTGPAAIRENQAEVVLDGPQARFSTTWLGTETERGLANLSVNSGHLALLNGAALQLDTNLNNWQSIDITGGSRLDLGGAFYRQWETSLHPATATTRVDGTLRADSITFDSGHFAAGDAGGAGLAHLLASQLTFGKGATFDVNVLDALHHGLVVTTAHASLSGILALDFTGGAMPGSFRILEADGGISGAFDLVTSDLDAASYRVSAVYGDGFVDIEVTSVPEPTSAVLTGLGLALLIARVRVRRERTGD